MGTVTRRRPPSVEERLKAEPHAFEFQQLVALLERRMPQAEPIGTGTDPAAEAVRLRAGFRAVFSASEVSSMEEVHGQRPPLSVMTQFFGLGGPDGPLPYAYQEGVQEWRLRQEPCKVGEDPALLVKDPTPAEFLDLFQHRLLAFLYRVRRKARLAPAFVAPLASPGAALLLALVGLNGLNLADRQAVPDVAFIAHAALLSNRRRSLAGWEKLIRCYFGVTIVTRAFVGSWRTIPNAARTLLCSGLRPRRLGRDALLGTRAWDEHAGIEIKLGPLSRPVFEDLLPGGGRHRELGALALFYFGTSTDCHVRLELSDEEVPNATLACRAGPCSWGRLGMNTWLKASGMTSAAREVGYVLKAGTTRKPGLEIPS